MVHKDKTLGLVEIEVVNSAEKILATATGTAIAIGERTTLYEK